MPKATLTLSSGTLVTIEGTAEEVSRLLELHEVTEPRKFQNATSAEASGESKDQKDQHVPSFALHDIVNLVRDCDEAERIETRVLDGRSQVDRTLLPLHIVHKHLGDRFPLAASEIAEICKQLGVPVALENVAKMLRGPASKFVMIESGGPPKRFKINRRGAEYFSSLLSEESQRSSH
jgi:hypothetical protein